MIAIGMLKKAEPDQHQQAHIEAKRQEFEAKSQPGESNDDYPASAQLCKKCQTRAVISLDNCLTCLHCGDSKCS
jgi:hypothetical protein